MISSRRVPKSCIAVLLVTGAGFFMSHSRADDGLKKNYILRNFVEETGTELGYGHYEDDSTADRGKQCKATFRVSEGKSFSITSTTVKGPNGLPVAVTVKDHDGAGSPVVPSVQSDGTGWTALTHAADGMKSHDGTWTVYLPRVKSASPAKGGGQLGCGSHNGAVRVVFEASL